MQLTELHDLSPKRSTVPPEELERLQALMPVKFSGVPAREDLDNLTDEELFQFEEN